MNPVWNYTFVYEDVTLQELAERCLELTVWDHDRLASNEFLGGVRFSLGTGKTIVRTLFPLKLVYLLYVTYCFVFSRKALWQTCRLDGCNWKGTNTMEKYVREAQLLGRRLSVLKTLLRSQIILNRRFAICILNYFFSVYPCVCKWV